MKYQRAFILALVLLLAGNIANAQQSQFGCAVNKTSPPTNTWHWPAGTLVKVHLVRGMFTPDQQLVIREVMDQWNNLSGQVGAEIKYKFEGEVARPPDAVGDLTLTRIEIMRGTNKKFFAYFFPTRNADGLLHSGIITFDFQTTDLAALKSLVAHEISHGMGLFDCKSCKRGSTIMNGFSGVNKGNGLVGPSACDLHTVKALFQQQQKAVRHFANH